VRAAEARAGLVEALGRAGIRDGRVLDAMGRVPRERFVPDHLASEAYADRALPIGDGQTISQPFIVARMTELLDPQSGDRVLEVGGGSGYQAAVLSLLVGDVVSVERNATLAAAEAARLTDLGYANVRVVHGDGSQGYADAAPYDGILIAAATSSIDAELIAQCEPTARIVAPVGRRESQMLTVRHGDGRVEEIDTVQFVPLVGSGGFSE